MRKIMKIYSCNYFFLKLEFASRILQNSVNPRNGNKSDQAHPPIHPIKYSSDLAVCYYFELLLQKFSIHFSLKG